MKEGMDADYANAPPGDAASRRPPAPRSPAADEDLSLLVDSARDFAMIFTDPQRRVVRWSHGAEHVLGWTEEEARAESRAHPDFFFTPEDRAAGVPEREQATALREGRAEDERWHLKKGGVRFFASGVLVPLYDRETHALRGFGKVLRDVTDREQLEEALRRANEALEARVAARTGALEARTRELSGALAALSQSLEGQAREASERRALAARLVAAQEEERRRISRELHDEMGQLIAAFGLAIGALEGARPEFAAELADLKAVADAMAREVHRLAVELRPTALDDLGLEAALRAYCEEWSARTGVPVAFESVAMPHERLPPEIETTVYRVVQEALTNAAKYAVPGGARRVSVTLQDGSGLLRAIVEDDGPGFDPAAAARSGRLGLVGMRERAEVAGGTLQIESEPGGAGTTVFLRLPLT